jgi:intracellular multiplication protein IcmE
MLKKGMSILSRYPRLRVLFFGVGAVTVVGVTMHVFTKKQDISKTPSGPVSHVDTQPVPLDQKRIVGNGNKYSKLKNQYDKDQYNNKLRKGETIMPNNWFNGKTQKATDGSGDNKSGQFHAKGASHNSSVNNAAHKQVAAANRVDSNSSAKAKPMMSPSDFQKAMIDAEKLSKSNTNASTAQMPSQNAGSVGSDQALNNFHSGRSAYGSNNLNHSNNSFHPGSYNPPHAENPQESQQHQQNIANLSSKMQGQLSSLGSSWNMPVASQNSVTQTVNTDADSTQGAAQKAADALANPPQIIKAATVYFAIINNKVSSDQPNTPIMAKIITGPYKGAKLLGGFYTEKEKLLIKFNTMVLKSRSRSFSIGTAYAIDTKDGQNAVATDVNHHYVLRYGSLFAAALLQGIGQAYTPSSNYCFPDPAAPGGWSCNGSGSGVNNPNQVNTKVALMRGAGQIGTTLGQNIGSYFNTPPTVTVAQGTLVGVLFMGDVEVPKVKVIQTDPDYDESVGTDLSFLGNNN